MGIFGKRTREQRFWDWFGENSDRLFYLEDDQERIFAELGKALRKVEVGLAFEFSVVEDGRREFCVSADGLREHFPAVRELVAAAPAMPRWDVVAFRQPAHGRELAVVFDGQRLSPDDLWFVVKPDEDVVHVDLYVPGLTDANSELMTGAAFILLDSTLGEEVVAERLGEISFEPLVDDPELVGLAPFRELPNAVRRVAG